MDNLILHPGHSSIFLVKVTIKFRGRRGRGTTYGTEGREKQIPALSCIFNLYKRNVSKVEKHFCIFKLAAHFPINFLEEYSLLIQYN